jgi:low affinity Fe/Cu permease
MRERFRQLAYLTAEGVGSPWAFLVGVGFVLLWGLSGPYFHFSDTWQLVINTSTTIITFLVVFLIQGAQNRDSRALHLKLDELLRAVEHARTSLVALENRTDAELETLQTEFDRLQQRHGDSIEACPDGPAGEVTGQDQDVSGSQNAAGQAGKVSWPACHTAGRSTRRMRTPGASNTRCIRRYGGSGICSMRGIPRRFSETRTPNTSTETRHDHSCHRRNRQSALCLGSAGTNPSPSRVPAGAMPLRLRETP